MVEDNKNLRLSRHASDIANQLKETGYFDDALSVAKFGMAYAIKYYLEDIKTVEKLEELDLLYDSMGNNYNIGSVDPDNYISKLFSVLYPNSTTPYRYVRIVMCFGLNKLGDLLDERRLFPINKLM